MKFKRHQFKTRKGLHGIFSSTYSIKPPPERLRSRLKTLYPLILHWLIEKVLSNFDSEIRKISNTFTISSSVSNLFLIELMFSMLNPLLLNSQEIIICFDRARGPHKEEELLSSNRLCLLSCQEASNTFKKTLTFLKKLAISLSFKCSFPLFNCFFTLILSCEIVSVPLFSKNSLKVH